MVAALVASLAVASLPVAASAETDFDDVGAGSTHGAAIQELADAGILLGYGDGTFGPRDPITRGQIASVLARAEGLDPVTPDFSDVPAGSTHAGAIGALVQAGVIQGYEDGTFRPRATIRRDHMAVLVARWLDADPVADGPFTDVTRYAGEINALYELGVVNGTTATTFDPDRNLSRGQAASFVSRSLALGTGIVDIKLLATNDFHGRLLPPSGDFGGAEYLSAHLKAIRDANPNTLHVDAGDLVGATPVLSNLFYDEPSIEVMNEIGLDVMTVGNHEFDRGQDEILRRFIDGGCLDGDCDYRGGQDFDGADFPILSTNVIVDETDEALTQDYEIIDVDGVDVGFVGVTTENTPNVVSPAGIQGLTFLPEAEAVNATVPAVKEAGADIVVVLMHEGGRQDGDSNSCENFTGRAADVITQFDEDVDVVVSGHTHRSYVCDFDDGPLATQAFEYGKMFTEIDLTFDTAAGELVSRSAVNHDVTRDIDPDPAVTALIDQYEELSGDALQEVVGESEVFIERTTRVEESAQGNLATDALLYSYADSDIDFAFQNSGGLRADLTQEANFNEDTGNYDILREDVLAVWPFGNIVALAEIDGEQLEEFLAHGVSQVGAGLFIQVGGLRIDYEIVDESGEWPEGQLVNVEYWNHPDFADGEPVDLSADATYRIALNDFMSVGGDGYPDIEEDVFSLQDPLEIAVEQYLLDNSPVNPQVEGRIVDVTED